MKNKAQGTSLEVGDHKYSFAWLRRVSSAQLTFKLLYDQVIYESSSNKCSLAVLVVIPHKLLLEAKTCCIIYQLGRALCLIEENPSCFHYLIWRPGFEFALCTRPGITDTDHGSETRSW